jgi:hypothetical protein
MSDYDDEVIASSSKANSGIKHDIKNKTVSTVKGKNQKDTKPAGKQPAKVGCKTNAFAVLTGPKDAAPLDRGKGTGRNSNKTSCFCHEHWKPVDETNYSGDLVASVELRALLYNDNADVQCNHCGLMWMYNPPITLGTHLLGACTAFQESAAWNSVAVQSGLAKKTSKQVSPARHFVFKWQLLAQQAILSVTSAPKLNGPFKFALRCAEA